jgi:hypothetical protein
LAQEYVPRAFHEEIPFDMAYWQARKSGNGDVDTDFRLSCEFDLP